MTPPHCCCCCPSGLELWRIFPSEAWDSSECAAAREPLKALEQGEVVVVVAIGGGEGSESVWAEKSYCYGNTRAHLTAEMCLRATVFSLFTPWWLEEEEEEENCLESEAD